LSFFFIIIIENNIVIIMSLLLSCQNLSKSYGSRQLFCGLSFGIFKGDRIGLIGPNGSGKSTLLKILAGLEQTDEGSVTRTRSLRMGYIPQQTIFPDQSLQELMEHSIAKNRQTSLEDKHIHIAITLSKLGFTDPSLSAAKLSGGWKKRLALGLELIHSPDLLFLDEPTNHLDLEGIIWLEKFLQQAPFAFIVISHDRYFLEHTTKRMMELNKSYPKGLFTVEGSYTTFLQKREEFISGQLQQERSLSSKVRREVEWLKQNPKARTTKSQSRIQEAERLIQELQGIKTRNREDKSQLDFSSSQKESHKLLMVTHLTQSMGQRLLFSDLHLTLSPGTRLGIAGPNGSGKTTLLRLLAGELTPDKGTIKYAEGLKIAYFDQHRAQLPSEIPLRRALAPEGETVYYRGQSIHVNSWCRRFLFSPDRLDLPFGQLSGGEQARVHLARLMLIPADLLLLDEPTNDLDIPTLEILETSLIDFPGAVVLISHDRYILNQVCGRILGLGSPTEMGLFADYQQWENHQSRLEAKSEETKEKTEKKDLPRRSRDQQSKMTYAEKREWEQIETNILQIEQEIKHLERDLQDPLVMTIPLKMQQMCEALNHKQHALEKLYERWQELEIKGRGS
jgi:ABC transport system ATP-binding/permease protein